MEKPFTRLEFTTTGDIDEHEALELIAERVALGETEGRLDSHGVESRWRLSEVGVGIEIDRRQRLAAVALMMAADLPQEMSAWASTMIEAAQLCPGMHTGEIPEMGPDGRRQWLEFARRLIDDMLAETAA